jgi:hypothetical protein
MGLDIYLEALTKNKEDTKIQYSEDEILEIFNQNEIEGYEIEEEQEHLLLDKLQNDYGLAEIVMHRYNENDYYLRDINNKEAIISYEELENKYTAKEKVKIYYTDELYYERYGYISDNFNKGYNPFFEEGSKYLKNFYNNPNDMDDANKIFKNPSRWIRIKEHFKELKEKQIPCFVFVSY